MADLELTRIFIVSREIDHLVLKTQNELLESLVLCLQVAARKRVFLGVQWYATLLCLGFGRGIRLAVDFSRGCAPY